MNKVPDKTIGTKVKYETAGMVMQLAGKAGLTVSTYLKRLIERDIDGSGKEKDVTLDVLVYEKEIADYKKTNAQLNRKIKEDNKKIMSLGGKIENSKNNDLSNILRLKEQKIKEQADQITSLTFEVSNSRDLIKLNNLTQKELLVFLPKVERIIEYSMEMSTGGGTAGFLEGVLDEISHRLNDDVNSYWSKVKKIENEN